MRYSKFHMTIAALVVAAPTFAADGPSPNQIRYDNAAMCSAYMDLAVGYAETNAGPGQEDAVNQIKLAAHSYHDFAVLSGVALGDNEAAVDAKIAAASAKLQKDSESLNEAAFDEADTHLFEHCVEVGPGKANEFKAYHPPWDPVFED